MYRAMKKNWASIAKVTISENSTVMAMMLRIIGRVTKRSRCQAVAPSTRAAS